MAELLLTAARWAGCADPLRVSRWAPAGPVAVFVGTGWVRPGAGA